MKCGSLSFQSILDSSDRIRPFVPCPTPLRSYHGIDSIVGNSIQVFVKHENFLPSNSFQYRCAASVLTTLPQEERKRGIVLEAEDAYAQAIKSVSHSLGISCRVGALSGHLNLQSPNSIYGNRERSSGAGTLILEMLMQNPEIEALVLGANDGLLLEGALAVVQKINPTIKIYAVRNFSPRLIRDFGNDGLIAEWISVSHSEVVEAIRIYLKQATSLSDASGALGLAGLLQLRTVLQGKKVGVVLSGGNIEYQDLQMIVNKQTATSPRQLSLAGRSVRLSEREWDCIQHLYLAKTSREIAAALGLSTRTVEFYLENIKNKLGCHRKSEILSLLHSS